MPTPQAARGARDAQAPQDPQGLQGAQDAQDAPSFSPLYQQIKGLITRSLQQGEWLPGQPIPSETELAARFRVSQGTVRKAVDELAIDNLLVRRQGRGTFVATHAEAQVQYRFLRLTADDGTPQRLQRRLVCCRRVRAAADIARPLGIRSGDAVVATRRLLLADDKPVVLDDLFLPAAAFRGLSAERMMAWSGSMYRLLEAEFGVRMIRAEERIRAVVAGPEQAAALGLASGHPLLSVERLSFTYGDRPMELRRGLYLTDSHHYRNELN